MEFAFCSDMGDMKKSGVIDGWTVGLVGGGIFSMYY